jgi:hypothetical protein
MSNIKVGDQLMNTMFVDRCTAAKIIREGIKLPCSEKWLAMLERTDCRPPFAYDGCTSWYYVPTLIKWVLATSATASYEAARKIRFKSHFLQTSDEPAVHGWFVKPRDIDSANRA